MKRSKQQLIEKLCDEQTFLVAYLLNLFLSSVTFFDRVGPVLTALMMAWAAVIFYKNYAGTGRFYQIKYKAFLVLFLISGFITALMHIGDNFLANMVMLMHAGICFFVFYGMHTNPDKEKAKRGLFQFFRALIIITSVLGVAGLLIILLFVQIKIGGYEIGVSVSRYTGLYTNPNLAGFSSVIALIGWHIFFYRKKEQDLLGKGLSKRFQVFSVVSNSVVLLLSDSNDSLLLLLVYAGVMALFSFYRARRRQKKKHQLLRSVMLLTLCAALCFSVFAARDLLQEGTSDLITAIQQSENTDRVSVSEEETKKSPVITIGRGEYEVSSGRLKLLEKAVIVYSHHPFMGIGKGNIVDYGERYLIKGFAYDDLHNGYLTILLSCGLVGLMLFLPFLMMAGVRILKCVREHIKKKNSELPGLAALLFAYAVFSLFEKALLFDITFMVIIFWAVLGLAMTYVTELEPSEADEKEKESLLPVPGSYWLPGYSFSALQFEKRK